MSTEHIDNVKNELERLIDSNPYDAHEVAYGCKHTNGVYTEEKVIRFGVERKLPTDQITPDKIIPKTITINGVEYKTDVYVAPVNVFTSAALRKIDDANPASLIHISSLSYCNPIETTVCLPLYLHP